MKLRAIFGLAAAIAVVCLSQAAVALAGGGNSANAKLCQDGWQTLHRSDGSSFANQGACVSYAAQGGTLVSEPQSQIDCTSFGGIYAIDSGLPAGEGGWSCFGFAPTLNAENTLIADCTASGSNSQITFRSTLGDTSNGACVFSTT